MNQNAPTDWLAKNVQIPPTATRNAGEAMDVHALGFDYLAFLINIPFASERPKLVIWQKSARIGFSTGAGGIAAVGAERGISSMVVQASELDQREFSHEVISALVDGTRALKKRVDQVSKSARRRLSRIEFSNGATIQVRHAKSRSTFRRVSTDLMLLDEFEIYPPDLKGEGSPLSLAQGRTFDSANPFIIAASTPSDIGLIESEIEQCDLLFHWQYQCSTCGHWQPLKWTQLDPETQIEYGITEADGEIYHACKQCGALETEQVWKSSKAHWRTESNWRIIDDHTEQPRLIDADGIEQSWNAKIGLKINSLSSEFATWNQIYQLYLDCGDDPTKLRTFFNIHLGESWLKMRRADTHELQNRKREIKFRTRALRTLGVDVQSNRIEATLAQWSDGEKCSVLEHVTLHGNTDNHRDGAWIELAEYLKEVKPTATMLDSGYETRECYRFARNNRRVHCTKGVSTTANQQLYSVAKKRNSAGLAIIAVNTTQAKDHLFDRLTLAESEPRSIGFNDRLDPDYFTGLMSEVKRKVRRSGRYVIKYEPIREPAQNEPLDCWILAYIAMHYARDRGVPFTRPESTENQRPRRVHIPL